MPKFSVAFHNGAAELATEIKSRGEQEDVGEIDPSNLVMKDGRQNIHLKGTKEYNDRVEASRDPNSKYFGKKPSYFTISKSKLDRIVKKMAKPSDLKNKYFFIDSGETIAVYVDAKSGKETLTSRMKVHLASNYRYHAVPAPSIDKLRSGQK